MKLSKTEWLFILYVILQIASNISSFFTEEYQIKFNNILNKLAVMIDGEKD